MEPRQYETKCVSESGCPILQSFNLTEKNVSTDTSGEKRGSKSVFAHVFSGGNFHDISDRTGPTFGN